MNLNLKDGSPFELVLRDTADRGKGIFANEDIPAGRKIVTNFVMPIPEHELATFDKSFIGCHLLFWDKTFAIGLGVSIYLNHSENPNVKFVRYFDDCFLEVFSLVAIAKGTELTHRYANPQRHPAIAAS